jgi:predicted acyltransferase
MATEAAGHRRTDVPLRATTRRSTETKHSSKTTELYVLIASVIGVLVAAQVTDDLTARWAWILVSALAIGYMLSRGFAKSGSDEPFAAHNGDDRL